MEDQLAKLDAAIKRVLAERKNLLAAAYEALEYFEDRSDIVDGDYGVPQANTEMRLAQTLQAAIEFAERG